MSHNIPSMSHHIPSMTNDHRHLPNELTQLQPMRHLNSSHLQQSATNSLTIEPFHLQPMSHHSSAMIHHISWATLSSDSDHTVLRTENFILPKILFPFKIVGNTFLLKLIKYLRRSPVVFFLSKISYTWVNSYQCFGSGFRGLLDPYSEFGSGSRDLKKGQKCSIIMT